MSIVLNFLTFVLILVSIFLVLVVLAQKSKDGGVGAALGGGATEAAFGADTTNVLSKSTIYAAITFFVLAFALYLGRIAERKAAGHAAGSALPAMATPAAPAPVPATATAPATTTAPTTAAQPAATTPATPAASVPATPATATPAATTPAPAPETKK